MAQVAAIDVGSNSVLLLLAEVAGQDIRVIDERCAITGLGKGLDRSDRLDPAATERTLAVLRDYGGLARDAGANIVAVGTEALRRTRDQAAFVAHARAALGADLEIITPQREAALVMLAVDASFPELPCPLVALDLGGGSTEVIVGRNGTVEAVASMPLGSVRLHERHVAHDPPTSGEIAAIRAEVDEALARCALAPPVGAAVVGVAATVTTLAAVAGSVTPYDGARVQGTWLSADEIGRQIGRYARMSVAERRTLPGLDPRRAEVILAGALLLERLLGFLAAPGLRVSDRGVRWGLLYEIAGRQ